MKIIYSPVNAVEARLLQDILQQEGITTYISGEYLQGGMGELPVMGLINLLVEDDEQYRAERVIRSWERGDYAITADTDVEPE